MSFTKGYDEDSKKWFVYCHSHTCELAYADSIVSMENALEKLARMLAEKLHDIHNLIIVPTWTHYTNNPGLNLDSLHK